MNLAENSRDAMRERGGRLTIRTRNEAVDSRRAAAVPGLAVGDYAVVSVADTGAGMDAATLARAFEPFFTTKRVGRGTGLGLATVHGIVQQSGGHVVAESVPGRGSTFTVYLPRHAGVSDGGAASRAAAAAPDAGTVLLVEEQASVRLAVRRTLERAGHAVLEAANGAAALALLSLGGLGPDLALVDVVTCGAAATELVDRLRQGRPTLPVLLMCDDGEQEVGSGGEPPDGVPMLIKPFTPESLLAAVRAVLGEGRPAR
jgi:CheY-like chemotaxis protein